eukprot:g8300.t1
MLKDLPPAEGGSRIADYFTFQQDDPFILVPFFGYMVGVFLIAVIAHRYQNKKETFEAEYYVGSRSFGTWVLALSWVATMASGGSFLGYPSRIYSYGWSMAFWVSGSIATAIVGLGIVGKRINRLARQTGALTLVDLLRDRFQSHSVGVVYAVVIVFVTTIYLVAQFVAGARILESMLGTKYETGLALFAISVVAYTTYGGFRAVAWTDTLQGIVMIVGVVLLVPYAIDAAGGLENATRSLAERPDPALKPGMKPQKHSYLYLPGPQKLKKTDTAENDTREDVPPSDKTGTIEAEKHPDFDPWLPIGMGISYFLLRSLAAVMMPTTVPRLLAFKDTRSLRQALMVLAPYFLLMYGCGLISMNCAYAVGIELPPDKHDLAVPTLAAEVAHPLIAGLLIAAPFAAVMSTVDSALLVISAAVVRDLVQKTWMPTLKTESTMRLSYAITGGVGVLVFVIALGKPPYLQPLIIYYSGCGAAALFWPSLASLFWKRATAAGVIAGLIGGSTVFVVCDFGVFSAGNGPAMRAAIFGAAIDEEGRLVELVRLSTRITHTDPKAEFGALAVAIAAQMSKQDDHSGERLLAALSRRFDGEGDELIELLQSAVDSVARGQSTADFAQELGLGNGVSGYVYHTVPVCIHAWLSHPTDFRNAVTTVIACGGDADSTAAIVGGIVGTGVGKPGIPNAWLNGLLEWPRSVSWMERLAGQLAESRAAGTRARPRGVFPGATMIRNVFFLAVVVVHVFRRALPPY